MVNSPFTYRSNCSPDFPMEVLSCEISTPDTSLREIYLESDIFLQYTFTKREKSYCVFDRVSSNSNKFFREVEWMKRLYLFN